MTAARRPRVGSLRSQQLILAGARGTVTGGGGEAPHKC
jgi:hypothetical protein